MKADSYLNLCIEQARLSPLHFRHGCVVVKGGKVIGQGFNDYRPGYDGGSVLKTGVLPKTASPFDGRARSKSKPDKNKSSGHPDSQRPQTKFMPVEALAGNCGGGGHHANARLSMHSEMMAINSALTSSSALAANTVSHVKPRFKLPGDSKRKRELRRQTLAAYVRAVCLEAACGAGAQSQVQCAGKAQDVEWRFEPAASRCHDLSSSAFSTVSEREREREQEGERESEQDRLQPVQQVQVI